MSSKTIKYLLVFLMSILILTTSQLQAEGNKKDSGTKLNKTDAQTASTYLDINNISSFFYNNGISDIASSGNSGFVYPKGSGRTAVFTSGLLWGAKVSGFLDPRVGGTAYRTGLVPGRVLADGTADVATLDKYRIYRVRMDVYPGGPTVDLTSDAKNEGISASDLRTAYETDWTQWPADMGAPFKDTNGDGVYQADKDIPGFPGADQTLWYITNDLNSTTTTNLYNSNPLGIECQVTIWAYNRAGALGNMYFRKYKLINTTNRTATPITFNDMYVSMWSDVDLGDAGDDFVGVDTVLSLQYCYNAAANDNTYSPLPPPAVGFDFFQGPVVNGVAGEDINKNGIDDASDYAIFNNQKVGPGKINLPMTAAYYFANGDPNIGDPPQGTTGTADGFRQFYNFFQGKFGISGTTFTDLVTGLPTTYALSGDPVKRTGWLDGRQLPAGDRRQGSASGPFIMAPGDTQEVVVAEIVAGAIPGVDRLSAIELLKFYDQQAQVAYDNFFDLPTAPPTPVVTITTLDKEIVLDWSKDEAKFLATENSNSKGYKFQGYNVYQLPTAFSAVSEGFRVATYDMVDGISKINDKVFDSKTGSVVTLPVQFGNDNGVKRFISITNDLVRGGVPLVNGVKYYFAVTSYSYNPDPLAVPNNLENPISVLTIVPQLPDPGVTFGEAANESLEIKHTGTADGSPSVSVVDPAATLGHDYEVFFTDRKEIKTKEGDWIPGSKLTRKFSINHPDTLTGSSIDVSGGWGPSGEVELHFLVKLESADGDWADGISLNLPLGTTILSAPAFEAGNGSITPVVNGNTVILGDTSHPYTKDGPFAGKEEFVVVVSSLTLPATIDWVIYDDGYGGGPVDASGASIITKIGFTRTALYWNLKDVTSGAVKLENQGIVVDKADPTGFTTINLFPTRDDVSAKSTTSANPVVDGYQIGLHGGYDAPIEFNADKTSLNEGSKSTLSFGSSASSTKIVLTNYTIYGTATSQAFEAFQFGTQLLSELQQDYELRFTGVWDTVVVGTQTIIKIKDGTGSMATIFSGLDANSLKNHPLNPNPGSAVPFLVRIPFEVWNKDTKKQVNLMFRDRTQAATASPFFSWYPKNRNYAVIVNSDYDSTTALISTDTRRSKATWVLVLYGTNYHVGDILSVYYDNPFVIGGDKYTFSTKGSSFSKSLAESQVDKINVFPNPYYGVNSEELNKYNRFVTFSHLPTKATIRIFNLAGVNVKTIEKVTTGQFQRWDLANEAGLPVASGLYIVYIDLPELGKTKILKVAVIQEKQILDRF
ncbi:MAG: T9SS type A sorting domain-containing protein [Ignavibacteriaceae bacterium]|jgi:hypothetical protein